MQTWTHKTHHGPNLGEAITFSFIVYFVLFHKAHIQMAFCLGDSQMGVSKFSQLGFPRLWGPITLHADLGWRLSLKQSCNPCQDFSDCMLHATYTRGNRGDSWLLVVGSQIANLTFGFCFGHNLCFKYPNGSCEPILDICVSIAFQWYKELLNPLNFDPCNCFLKIRKSTRTPIPKVEAPFGSVRVHSLTLSYTFKSMKCDSRVSFLARNLASPYLGHKPKVRVATLTV
jgi:hypothetical protein